MNVTHLLLRVLGAENQDVQEQLSTHQAFPETEYFPGSRFESFQLSLNSKQDRSVNISCVFKTADCQK